MMIRISMILWAIIQVSNAWAVPAQGHEIMMSAPSAYAIEAGRKTSLAGGNAVDVAVSMALTLSVTSPYFASLGGGGFALVKMKDHPVSALDFRETAPAATGPAYYLKMDAGASRQGGTAVAIPGIPAGLYELHKRFGKLDWKKLFATAESLAENGFRVSGEWAQNTEEQKNKFNPAGREHFFKKTGEAYLPGEELKQPELAKALDLLRTQGSKGFYEGKVAADIVQAVKETGGVITLKDLKNYRVRWLTPIETDYSGYHLYLMPPPSSGGVLIKMALALTERANLAAKKALSTEEYHWLSEIESRVFRGRLLLGDPDFHTNPMTFLTSKSQLDFLFKSINPLRATKIKPLTEGKIGESTETTHLSVLDKDGNAVAMTITLNGDYGSDVVTPVYGIALNDEMDDFTTHPNAANMYGLYQGEGNNVKPGKRPLSSMSPALVEKNGQVMMAIGAPGGPRIISAVYQVLYRVLGRGEDIDRAIQTGRVHNQFSPDAVFVDAERFSPEVLDGLRKMGHKIEERGGIGRVYVVKRNDKGLLEGAFDSRGEGAAGGY